MQASTGRQRTAATTLGGMRMVMGGWVLGRWSMVDTVGWLVNCWHLFEIMRGAVRSRRTQSEVAQLLLASRYDGHLT